MLLKILLDPAFDKESYEDFQVKTRHEIYAEVSSANRTADFVEFCLKECPIISDAFEELPVVSNLTVFPESASLSCKWTKPGAEGLTYIELKVEVQECDRFPPIRSNAPNDRISASAEAEES